MLQLSLAEELLLSPIRTQLVLKMIPVREGGKRQAWKGNIISFPQDTAATLRSLPRPPSSLAESLKVVFCGATVPTDQQILKMRPFIVRPQVVRDAARVVKTKSRCFLFVGY